MQSNRRCATWAGAVLGVLLALIMNAALARAWDDDNDSAVKEEFHQTYPLTANGRVELENINGSVHISVISGCLAALSRSRAVSLGLARHRLWPLPPPRSSPMSGAIGITAHECWKRRSFTTTAGGGFRPSWPIPCFPIRAL